MNEIHSVPPATSLDPLYGQAPLSPRVRNTPIPTFNSLNIVYYTHPYTVYPLLADGPVNNV